MALPLPRVVADVGPGGGLVTAMGGINSLNNDMLMRKINQIKAQYAPLTTKAEAASKLAYANLMGPQFLAKIMGNDSALANMSEEQKKAALQKIYQAGSGQGGNPFANLGGPQQSEEPTFSGIGQPSTNSFSGRIKNAFHGLLGQDQNQMPLQNANPFSQPMPNRMRQVTQNKQQMPQDAPQTFANDTGENPAVKAYEAWGRSPEGQAELAKGENANIPDEAGIMRWAAQQQGNPSIEMDMTGGRRTAAPEPSYAENTGAYKGAIAEGEELGKIRAKAIDELDQQYQQAVQSEVPLKHMNEIITNPVFQKMREFPWFQNQQLGVLSKIGTPEQQKLVGDFKTTALKAVAETVMGFKGRILDKEVSLANDMKVSKNDTINEMLGKLPTIEAFNEMTKQRDRIASQLISQKHISRGDALEQADKMIDGPAIRKKIEMELSPEPTEEDYAHTAKTHNMSIDEVKKKYQAMRGK